MSYSFYNKKENRQVAGNEVTINDFNAAEEIINYKFKSRWFRSQI